MIKISVVKNFFVIVFIDQLFSMYFEGKSLNKTLSATKRNNLLLLPPPTKIFATFVFTFKNHLHLYKEKKVFGKQLFTYIIYAFSSMYNFLK